MKITIVSGIQLSNNPRVVKEADALAESGHDVTVLTSLLNPAFESREKILTANKPWECVRILDLCAASKLSTLRRRLRTRVANETYRLTGRGSVCQLGYVGPELLKYCLHHEADIFSVHLEQAFCVGAELLKKGFRVSGDFEDWYSEDLLPAARKTRPIKLLQDCESAVINDAHFSTATSQCMSRRMASRFGTAREPHVVLNTFSLAERNSIDGKLEDRREKNLLSIFWFSQTIGPKRGLEELMQATHHLTEPIEIHLRGNISSEFQSALAALAHEKCRPHVHFHPQVPHHELLSRIAEHDVGYAAEVPYCESRNLTITNKVFQYLLAGIPVIATDTAGQVEVADDVPDAMRVFSAKDPASLATLIEELQSGKWSQEKARASAVEAAQSKYNWEVSRRKLVSLFETGGDV